VGAKVVRVGSAAELHEAMVTASAASDAVVMAAAVADFRPETQRRHKIKKSAGEPEPLRLVRNPDVLADLAGPRRRPGQVVVGFAAETGDDDGSVLDHAERKLTKKGCDFLVVNDVSGGGVFGENDNQAVILAADGGQTPVPRATKRALAHVIWDRVAAQWTADPS
jgi:phosphopantothenoylcysteine decarboxylase/phosphopantothenate--cysteine ligase